MRPTKSPHAISRAGCRSAACTSPPNGTRAIRASSNRTTPAKSASRRRIVHALWQRRLHFLCLCLVPRVAGGRSRRLSPVRQHAERSESSVMERRDPDSGKEFRESHSRRTAALSGNLAPRLPLRSDLSGSGHFPRLAVHGALRPARLSDDATRLDRPVRLDGVPGFLRPVARPRIEQRQSISARRQNHAVVRHGPFHHGDPGQRHHFHFHHRPSLRRRHALRAVLFRPAHRDGDPLARPPCPFSIAPKSTPRTNIWNSASTPRRAPDRHYHLPDRPRPGRRHRAGCAGHRDVGDAGLAVSLDHRH